MHKLLRKLVVFWFKRSGWDFYGYLPQHYNKCVILGAPHTSKKDFFLALAVLSITGYRATMLIGKKSRSFWNRFFLNQLSTREFDFDNASEETENLIQLMQERKKQTLIFTNRNLGDGPDVFRETFYDVAVACKVPIVLVAFDYRRKVIKIHSEFMPSVNRQRDIRFCKNFFSIFMGKNPQIRVKRV